MPRKRTTSSRLAGALRFASADLHAANAMARAARELGQFLLQAPDDSPGSDTGGVWFGSALATPDSEELFELQPKVARVLDSVATGRPWSDTDRATLTMQPPRLEPSVAVDGTVILRAIDGTFSERYMIALLLLLAHQGAGAVKACVVCRRIFERSGKRMHCGRASCAKAAPRAAWRRWRQSDKGRRYTEERIYGPNGWEFESRTSKKR